MTISLYPSSYWNCKSGYKILFNREKYSSRSTGKLSTYNHLPSKFSHPMTFSCNAPWRSWRKIWIIHYLGPRILPGRWDLSQTRLYRKLVGLTGNSSNDFIRRIRLKRAADLLHKQAGNVSEVAYRVGFNSLSYFAKCFKQFHRHSPRDYAKVSLRKSFV